MAGSKFQYDESGSTFFYFLLSFEALVVIPCTYYLYPRNGDKHGQKMLNDKNLCHCENCRIKHSTLSATKPWKNTKERLIKFLLLIAWLALFLTAYKCCNLQHDYVAYDPFEILEIEPEASMAEIKKAYRRLSLVYHPDKSSGNEMKFMMLTKAYAALTDDEARKNWEMYGNPDGPGAMSFGIALPSWIIEKENSVWVLGLYALVFMVAMPVAVGIWWHRSVKFGTDAVLLDTTQLYLYFLYKSPRMIFRRIIMVIAASMEFRKTYNAKINERASDNIEVPQLIKQLPNIDYKNIEKPLCFSYSLKARALIHAHLSRLKLPARTLDEDRLYIVKKLPNLIHEFVQCSSQLTMLALSGRISRMPHLDTMESAMRLSQCIVQALWEHKSPFLQLPHITDDILRHFTSRRRNIRSVKNLATMKGGDRRAVLRSLTDDEYDDVMTVLSKMPVVDIEVKSEVIDDEDACTITAGALVTVTVTLHRRNLSTLFDNQEKDEVVATADVEDKQSEIPNGDISPKLKKPPKLVKGKKKKAKGGKSQILKKKKVPVSKAPVENKKSESVPETKETSSKAKDSDRESEAENEANTDCESGSDENEAAVDPRHVDDNVEDDAEWEKLQSKVSKRDKVLGTKSKKSHTVHCPFFPILKDEYWWLYIADKRKHVLKTAPFLVTSLVNTEEVELKFTAPSKPGLHTYSVILRSDSYFDVDVIKTIKLDVKEAMEIDLTKLQWDVSENEEEKDEEESAVEDSDLATDDEIDDD